MNEKSPLLPENYSDYYSEPILTIEDWTGYLDDLGLIVRRDWSEFEGITVEGGINRHFDKETKLYVYLKPFRLIIHNDKFLVEVWDNKPRLHFDAEAEAVKFLLNYYQRKTTVLEKFILLARRIYRRLVPQDS